MAKPAQPQVSTTPQTESLPYRKPTESKTELLSRLLHIAQYTTTTPWQILNIAVQQMIDIHNNTERNDIILQWAKDKRAEFKHVSLAGTIVASAVTGSIQWQQSSSAHWIVLAAWYGGLLLSLFCIIIAFHLSILIATYTARSDGAQKLLSVVKTKKGNKPSITGLYILQVPMMLLSYSIISYIMGLIIMVMEVLWRDAWSDNSKIALFFVPYLIFGLGTYVAVCFMIYWKFLPDMEEKTINGGLYAGRTMRADDDAA
ncbi:hypothetical protein MMC30_008007 [Trapelia coarctata]|nr:hypothetical protein [Trapelia coarctata]